MLVDMNLGDTTGMQLAQALRKDPVTAHVHLVALSADALPGQIRDALDGGFENYLTKPINFVEILRVFDGYSQMRESASAAAAKASPQNGDLHHVTH